MMLPISKTRNLISPRTIELSSVNLFDFAAKDFLMLNDDGARCARILLFSFDTDNLLLFRTFLGFWGFEVVITDSFEKLVQAARDMSFELVILDSPITLTESLQVIKCVREIKKIPIIVLSAHAQEQARNSAFASGATGFFVKPIDFDALEQSVKFLIKNGFAGADDKND